MPYIGKSPNFGVRNRFVYLASADDTSVSGADANGATLTFTDGAFVDVYLNGVLLKPTTDYNTNTANTIAGISSMSEDDEVTVVVYDVFAVGDTVSASSGGTFGGDVVFSAGIEGGVVFNEDSASVDFRVESNGKTHAFFVDGSADKVGINTSSPDALLDVEGTTDAEIRVTRTTASFSGSNTDAGSVLHLVNEVEFENGYGGDSNVGQILFTSNDDSTGTGLRAKIACHKLGFSHAETLSFYVSPSNTTSGQALASGTNNTSTAKHMEIDYNGTTTIGGDLFDGSGNKREANPVGLCLSMKDDNNRGIYFLRGATDNGAGDGETLGQVGARPGADTNTMAAASAKILFEQAGTASGSSAGCGVKIFTKDTSIGPGSAPTLKFAISSDGNLTATDTSIGSISDERLKKNIQDYSYNLDKFKQLKPRSFEWRNPSMHKFEDTTGFVAQELEAIDSSLSYDKEGAIDKPYAESEEVYKEGDTIPSGKKVGDLLPDAQEKKDAYDAEMALLNGDKQKAAKLGKKDAMYISVIQQLIARIEALESV